MTYYETADVGIVAMAARDDIRDLPSPPSPVPSSSLAHLHPLYCIFKPLTNYQPSRHTRMAPATEEFLKPDQLSGQGLACPSPAYFGGKKPPVPSTSTLYTRPILILTLPSHNLGRCRSRGPKAQACRAPPCRFRMPLDQAEAHLCLGRPRHCWGGRARHCSDGFGGH